MKGTIGICAVALVLTIGYITMTHKAQSGKVLLEVIGELNSVKAKISQLMRNSKVKGEKVEKTLAGDLKNIERKMEKLKDTPPAEEKVIEHSAENEATGLFSGIKSKTGPSTLLDSSLLSSVIVDKIIESYLKGSLPVDRITKAITESPELLSLVPKLLNVDQDKRVISHQVRPSDIPTTLMKNIIEEQQDDEDPENAYLSHEEKSNLGSFMRLKSFAAQPSVRSDKYAEQLDARAVKAERPERPERAMERKGAMGRASRKIRSYLREPAKLTMNGLERMSYWGRSELSRKKGIEKGSSKKSPKELFVPLEKEHQNIFMQKTKEIPEKSFISKSLGLIESPLTSGLVKDEGEKKELADPELKEEEEPKKEGTDTLQEPEAAKEEATPAETKQHSPETEQKKDQPEKSSVISSLVSTPATKLKNSIRAKKTLSEE